VLLLPTVLSGAQVGDSDFRSANRLTMPRPSCTSQLANGEKAKREVSEPLSPSPASDPEEDCRSGSEWSEVGEGLGSLLQLSEFLLAASGRLQYFDKDMKKHICY